MRNRILLLLAAVVVLVAPAAASAEAIAMAGQVRLPSDVRYVGKVLEKGRYEVRITSGDEGPYFEISDSEGNVVIRELAIVREAKGASSGARSSVHVLTRDEHMLRLTVRQGSKSYLAYFEVPRVG